MKLTLEQIWKMADSLEEVQKFAPSKRPSLKEEAPATSVASDSSKELTIRLPKLQISENWGKADKVERLELERIVKTATGKADNVHDRLRLIQEQMDKLKTGRLGKIRSPRAILSKIILLETLNRMFKSFQPSPAGFINEAFLSVFYNSHQIDAGDANKEKNIGDITENGIPVSVKTKTKDALLVDGSVENLITSIQKNEKVFFDIYEKKTFGQDEKKHVGSLTFTRFVVDASNVNAFLGKKVITQDSEGNIIYTRKFKTPPKKNASQLDESEGDVSDPIVGEDLPANLAAEFEKSLFKIKKGGEKVAAKVSEIEKARILFRILSLNNFTLPRAGAFTQYINNLESTALKDLVRLMKNHHDNSANEEEREKISAVVKIIAGLRIGKATIEEPSEIGLEREFSIPESRWRIFADDQGSKEITISFSDDEIQKLLENAVENLNKSVVSLFNDIAGFSDSIQSYLTSMDQNRGQDGLKALQYAKKLEPSTQKVVSILDTEKDSDV